MQSVTQPSKEAVRSYLKERQNSHVPPPSSERVREILGWRMLEDERMAVQEVAR